MENERLVEKQLSVFDLRDLPPSRLCRYHSARIMFVFDKKANIMELTVLNKDIPNHVKRRITSDLQKDSEFLASFPQIKTPYQNASH